jgi:hypothetical protein
VRGSSCTVLSACVFFHLCLVSPPRTRIAARRYGSGRRIPCRSAVLAGLAEQEPQLLQALAKRVFRRHSEESTSVAWVTIGVAVSDNHIRCPCSSSSSMAPFHIRFSRRANRRSSVVIPNFQLWHRYRERTRTTPSQRRRHRPSPFPLPPTFSRTHSRTAKGRHSNHVVPPRLPHLQQLPALLPRRTRRCPPTSFHRRWAWRLRRLLEQPHWPQDRSFLVRFLATLRLNAPACLVPGTCKPITTQH